MPRASIVYGDMAVDASALFVASSPNALVVSDFENVVKAQPKPAARIATLTERNVLVFGAGWELYNYQPTPPPRHDSWGYVSNEICASNGLFATAPVLTLASPKAVSSPGLTLIFDEAGESWPKSMRIQWYRGDQQIADELYEPKSVEFFAQKYVSLYDRVKITFRSWILPYRYARVLNVQFGRGIVIDKLLDLRVTQEISPIGAEIRVNTVTFAPVLDSYNYRFQKGQRVDVFFGETLVGVYFIHEIRQKSRDFFECKAVDYVSTLDASDHAGGVYEDVSARELIGEICALAKVPVRYEASDIFLSGWLPYDSARNNLTQICFAAGLIADTAFSDSVRIYSPTQTPTNTLAPSDIFMSGAEFDERDPPSSVSLSSARYVYDDETAEIYSAEKSGRVGRMRVIFETAHKDLTITDGAIIEYGDNYADINAGENCVLSGTPLLKYSTALAMDAPDKTAKPLLIDAPTMVTEDRAIRLLPSLFAYYQNPYSIHCKATDGTVRCGSLCMLYGTYIGSVMGLVEKMEFQLNGTKLFPTIDLVVRDSSEYVEYQRSGEAFAGENGLW
jgi:hypothetical protein